MEYLGDNQNAPPLARSQWRGMKWNGMEAGDLLLVDDDAGVFPGCQQHQCTAKNKKKSGKHDPTKLIFFWGQFSLELNLNATE